MILFELASDIQVRIHIFYLHRHGVDQGVDTIDQSGGVQICSTFLGVFIFIIGKN